MQPLCDRLACLYYRFAFIVNSGLFPGYVILWSLSAMREDFWRADFSAFYTGWAIILAGDGSHLYDLQLQGSVQHEVLSGRLAGILPFINPPQFGLLFAPLAFLSLSQAFYLWAAGQFLLLLVFIYLLVEYFSDWTRTEKIFLITTTLALPMLFRSFMLGSLSVLGALILVAFCAAIRQGRETTAGLLLSLGAIKPQYMFVPLIFLLGSRRWKALIAALLSISALTVTTSIQMGWAIWQDYYAVVKTIGAADGIMGVLPGQMYNFKSTLYFFLGSKHPSIVNIGTWMGLAFAALLTLVLSRNLHDTSRRGEELRLAFLFVLGLFFTPHLNPQDGFLLVVPAALFFNFLRGRNTFPTAYACFVILLPLLFLLADYFVVSRPGSLLPPALIGVLVLWMGCEDAGRHLVKSQARADTM